MAIDRAVQSVKAVRLIALAVVVLFFGSLAGVSVHQAFDVSTGANGAVQGIGSSNGVIGGDSADAGTAGDSAGDTGGGGGSSDTGSSTATGGSQSTSTASTIAGGSTAAGAHTGVTAGPKSTLPPLVVGIHDSDAGAAFSQYGVKGGPSGDQGPWIKEVQDWINGHGGMGGRKLELVSHVTPALNGTFDQQAEEACVDFTEDHKVSVVVGGALVPTLALADCLAAHKTPLVWNYVYLVDQATLSRYANYLYMPSMVQAERLGNWIDAVADAGYFKGGTVGLVRYDEPIQKRLADTVVKPRMAARGVKVTDEAAFRSATGAASAADLSAQANSTILRFRSENVNRVMFQPAAAVLPLLFLTSADAQNFHPLYSYTSYDEPEFQTENNTASQLAGSLVYGWLPAEDMKLEQSPPLNAAAKRCVDITHDADPPGNGSIRRYCDGLMFLKAVFDKGADPSVAGIRRGIDALGSSYESAWTFSVTMNSQRHDGASVARLVAYDTGCSCYKYTGPERPIQ